MGLKCKKYSVAEGQRNKISKREKRRKVRGMAKEGKEGNKERKNDKEGMFIAPMNLVYTCRRK